MRLFELKSEFKSRPIVYVDLDNTLADFFGAVAKAHDVKVWTDISRSREAELRVAKQKGFFENLEELSNAQKLIKGVTEIAGGYSILSSPLQSDVESSVEQKSQWIRNHLTKFPPNEELFSHQKFRYAKQADGTPNILIDDWPVNIELWEAHGGIGIQYRNSKVNDALHKLKRAIMGKRVDESANPLERYGSDYVIPFSVSGTGISVLAEGVDSIVKNEQYHQITNKLYTSAEIVKYVKGIHHEYHLTEPINKFKTWQLVEYPVDQLKTPEFFAFDDPYKRIIHLDLEHIRTITDEDIAKKPIVVNENGWVLDGNHRATKAMMNNMDTIPAFVPMEK